MSYATTPSYDYLAQHNTKPFTWTKTAEDILTREQRALDKLDDAQRQALVGNVESGPIPAVHGVVRWRLIDLVQWLGGVAELTPDA